MCPDSSGAQQSEMATTKKSVIKEAAGPGLCSLGKPWGTIMTFWASWWLLAGLPWLVAASICHLLLRSHCLLPAHVMSAASVLGDLCDGI